MKTLSLALIIGLAMLATPVFAHTTMGYKVSTVHPTMIVTAGPNSDKAEYVREHTSNISAVNQ